MHCTLWGWEEWIKGETHSGKDISGGKVSLLNLSIQNKIDDKYVGMCVYVAVIHCVPLFTQCGLKQSVTSLTNTHTKKNIWVVIQPILALGPLKNVLVPTPPWLNSARAHKTTLCRQNTVQLTRTSPLTYRRHRKHCQTRYREKERKRQRPFNSNTIVLTLAVLAEKSLSQESVCLCLA